MLAMQALNKSWELFEEYPRNLVHQDPWHFHMLQGYLEKMHDQECRLFDSKQADVDFLDCAAGEGDAHSIGVTSLSELKELLRKAFGRGCEEPQTRFIFIHAPHSRAALRISHHMLKFLFSYYQVMPSFLEFIFPFGRQHHPQDYHFGDLKTDSFLDYRCGAIEIKELGRSGKDLRICYNLRSVERSTSQPGIQWSVRQTAIYHSFDLGTYRALWIVIKGNKLMKNRFTESLYYLGAHDQSAARFKEDPFSASLTAHLLLCEWSKENWRWYINDLEEELQQLTRDAVSIPVDFYDQQASAEPSVLASSLNHSSHPNEAFNPCLDQKASLLAFQSRSSTLVDNTRAEASLRNAPRHHQRANGVKNRYRCMIGKITNLYKRSAEAKCERPKYWWQPQDRKSEQATLPLSELPGPHKHSPGLTAPDQPAVGGCSQPQRNMQDVLLPSYDFSFADLQRINELQERLHDALLVIDHNIAVLEQLQEFYRSATRHADFPGSLKSSSSSAIAYFDRRVSAIRKGLRSQHSSTQTTLYKLSNRKTLLHEILQDRSTRASEAFAKKSQASADSMEITTNSMHEIAEKTRQETVSMHIITTVTLFFLPGTFVATLMSTDIIHFDQNKGKFSPRALKVYLTISVPLMALAFLAWYISYRLRKRGDALKTAGDYSKDPSEMA